MVKLEGKYSFVSQDNFEAYLTAAGVGWAKRKMVLATTPDIVVEIDGDNYTVSTVTSIKTIKISFTLGKEYEADPGTGNTAKYLTTLEGGDTLVSKEVENPATYATRKFSDTELIMTMTAKGVTATRKFKRVN